MTERVNLVDAYDNRSVIAKMVNMEERISGAETSVKASAEAAASSASAAAASQTAAKTSETNAKASADTAAATLANTVDLSSKQTVTGAKTFAGDTTVTGSFVTSGNAEMSKLDIDTGKLTVGSGGSAEISGPLTASNTANVIKAANHDSVMTSNDLLTAKDLNEVNGKANNMLHRNGNESKNGNLTLEGGNHFLRHPTSLGQVDKENLLLSVIDDDSTVFMREMLIFLTSGSLTNRKYLRLTKDGTTIMAYLNLDINSDNSVTMTLIKTVNGSETGRQVIAKLS